jgi:hypothetical protein
MKLHIVFELDTTPDAGLGELATLTNQAAASFKAALSPLGTCKLAIIKAANGHESTRKTAS